MCSPGLTQPNNAYQPGSGLVGFGSNAPIANAQPGMTASQMPNQQNMLYDVNTMGKPSVMQQPFQQNQKVMGGLQSGLGSFNASKFIK